MRTPILPWLLVGVTLFLYMGLSASQTTAAVTASAINSSTPLLSGAYADGQTGDLILENDEIVVVISAIGRTTYQGFNGGTVIDIGSSQDRVDALAELYTYFDDDWPRQAVYTSLTIADDGSSGGPAIARATGYDSVDPALSVITEYSLGDGSLHLTITTWVTNTGGTTHANFELGDAFNWGGCQKFAPGHGFSPTGSTTQPWLAGVADDVSYGYCGSSRDVWGPHGSYWSDMNVVVAQLGSGGSASYRRYLTVDDGDMASMAMDIHQLKGTDVGTVVCTVITDAGGSPIAGATIDAIDASSQLYLRLITAPDGQATTTLPPGTWRLVASAAGYLAAERMLGVVTGGSYKEQFTLSESGTTSSTIGDTLTVIQRPLLNIPAFARPGDILEISCAADPATTGWAAELQHGSLLVPLVILSASYDPSTLWWTLSASLPTVSLYELYDLRVTADGGIDDITPDAVRILSEYKTDYYFAHLTDTHLPDHQFSDAGGSPEDSTETVDFREVIADLNIIQPEFVLITGDFINEGELEDYLEWRSYTRAQRQLTELDVPAFLISGNHDLGGWSGTPPPDGTARRDWWRFFGWPRLNNPPAGAPSRTQDYSFDYGSVHYTALESYINYDSWRSSIYGSESFRTEQLLWLSQDLASAAASQSQVVFYHRDFGSQIDLNALGLEMALSGHTHSDNGSITSQPYDLTTNNVCDGERSYRMIHVSDGVVMPQATVSAGAAGQNLGVVYTPANDGTHDVVTANVTNNHAQQFAHAQLRFLMPKPSGPVVVTGGTLEQIDDSGSITVCYVAVDIQATGSQIVSVQANSTTAADANPRRSLYLAQSHPNPFGHNTVLRYRLPQPGPVTLSIFDLRGREIRTLIAGEQPAGEGSAMWDGRNDEGLEVASGVYIARLSIQGETRSHKLVHIR